MPSRSTAVLLALTLSSCRPTSPAGSTPSTVVVTAPSTTATASLAASSASATVEPEVDGPPLPDELRGPKSTACTLESDSLFSEHNWVLRLEPGGPEAIAVHGDVAATMQLSGGSPLDGAFVELHDARASLRGWLNGADVRLGIARPLVIAGYLVPYSWAALSWRGAGSAPGRVRVGAEDDPSVRFEEPAVQEVDCDAVTIGDPPGFKPLDALPAPVGSSYATLASASVAVAREPSGSTAAVIDAPRARVWTLGTEGSKTRILYPAARAFIFGWVDSSNLRATSEPASQPGTGGSWGWGSGPGLPFASSLGCDRRLPVVVEVDGKRATVGHLEANQTLQVSNGPRRRGPPAPLPPFRPVRLQGNTWFRVAGGAELLGRTAELERCAPPAETSRP